MQKLDATSLKQAYREGLQGRSDESPGTALESVTLFELFDELPSTNAFLNQLSRERGTNKEQLVLCATAVQTAGVGRRGKQWVSGPDCVPFSILQTLDMPPSDIAGLSLVTGLAIARTLQPMLATPLELKWPNDILANSRKLCGVLTELPGLAGNSVTVISGIGINYSEADSHRELERPYTTLLELSDGLSNPDTAGKSPDNGLVAREVLIGRIAAAVALAQRQFARHGWSYFREAYAERDCLSGKLIQIEYGSEILSGVARGVDESGALLTDIDGETRRFNAGEVSIVGADQSHT